MCNCAYGLIREDERLLITYKLINIVSDMKLMNREESHLIVIVLNWQ